LLGLTAAKSAAAAILKLVQTAINFVFRVCLLIALILTLSGCGGLGLGGAALTGALPGSWGGDYIPPPRFHCTTEDSIDVAYYTAEPNDQHDEAMQLISEHCVEGCIEIKPANQDEANCWKDRCIVYAKCLKADGSPADSQPCKYNSDGEAGFGQSDVTIPEG
jgi:hypothetical protein